MAVVSRELGLTEASETAKFCDVIDNFFDLLNVYCFQDFDRRKKEFLKP